MSVSLFSFIYSATACVVSVNGTVFVFLPFREFVCKNVEKNENINSVYAAASEKRKNESIRIQSGASCVSVPSGVYASSLRDWSCQRWTTNNFTFLNSQRCDKEKCEVFANDPTKDVSSGHTRQIFILSLSASFTSFESKCIEFYRLASAKQNYSDNRNEKKEANWKKKETWATRRQNLKKTLCGCIWSTSFYLKSVTFFVCVCA